MMSQFAQDIEKAVRHQALQEGIQQGMQQGMRKGLLEGEAKGEAKLLLRLLPCRFGPLLAEICERIYEADPNTIEQWADRVLDAKSLEDVFAE